MGVRVAQWVMAVGLVLLGAIVMVGAMQEAYGPPGDSGIVDKGCVQLMPHADYVTGEQWNTWVATHEATNVEYAQGVWYADGVAIGYSAVEDAAIYNEKRCVS